MPSRTRGFLDVLDFVSSIFQCWDPASDERTYCKNTKLSQAHTPPIDLQLICLLTGARQAKLELL